MEIYFTELFIDLSDQDMRFEENLINPKSIACQTFKSNKVAKAIQSSNVTRNIASLFTFQAEIDYEIEIPNLPSHKEGYWIVYPYAIIEGLQQNGCIFFRQAVGEQYHPHRHVRLYGCEDDVSSDNNFIFNKLK